MKSTSSIPIIHLFNTSSTSTYLKEMCRKTKLEEFTTVSAEYQTAGHGQAHNTWESEGGKNLLFSFVLYPSFCPAREQFHLSQLISLAIKDTLAQYASGFSIKWPNDIYWRDKKICGILIENELCGETIQQCIAGVGININQEEFKSDAPNPVSLFQIIHSQQDIEYLLKCIMKKVVDYYKSLRKGRVAAITRHYFNSLYRRDGFYPYKDAHGCFSAKIVDVLPLGTLILEDEGGNRRSYNFKEVSFVFD